SAREQGMTQSGNRHVRWMTTELAWSGLRLQPESALRVWFRERFGAGGKRLRRIGIVAVGRERLMALWGFLGTGGIPAGGGVQKSEMVGWWGVWGSAWGWGGGAGELSGADQAPG